LSLDALAHRVRPAAGAPDGALVLFHGRGADEHDLVPVLDGFRLDLETAAPQVAIGHGTLDPVISVTWARLARALLEEAGVPVLYRESPLPHAIDPTFLRELRLWLPEALPLRI